MIEIPIADLKGDTGPVAPETVVDLRRDADNVVLERYNGEEKDLGSFKGDKGDRGDDGANVIPTAAAVKNEVTNATDTRQFLDQRYLLLAPLPSGGDDYAVLQPLLLRAQNTGVPLYLQRGLYKLSAPLMTNVAFNQPIVKGFGRNITEIQGPAAASAIILRGGSGGLSGGVIEDLTVSSIDGTGTGIEFRGCGGVNVYRVLFKTLARGALFNNTGAGNFTEFCVIHDSEMATSVVVKAQFSRGSGNDSFHGSGFRNTILNQVASATDSEIIIGPDCKWYNAPLDITWFGRAEGTTLIRNRSELNGNTFGDIRTETSATKTHALYVLDAGVAGRHIHSGSVSHLSQGVALGTGLRLAQRTQQNNDGSSTSMEFPTESTGAITSGANTVASFATPGTTFYVVVSIIGPGYERSTTHIVSRAAGLSQITQTQLHASQAIDTNGLGPAVASVSGQSLVLTNASFPATGFTRRVTLTPLQGRSAFPLV